MLNALNFSVPRFAGHSGLSIVKADDEELSDLTYRFRYHVYVRLMQRRQIHADHTRCIVREPMDERGSNYLAVRDGNVVGSVRRNFLDDPAVGYYSRIYEAHRFGLARAAQIAMTTKLMVLPAQQRTSTPIKLLHAFAADGYRNGVQIDLIDCNKPLIPLFERMGFFSYRGWAFHKEFGTVRPMFLAVDALRYLRSIGSFLADASGDRVVDGGYGGYDLIRTLAQPPDNWRMREASQGYRSDGITSLACAPS